MIGYNAGMNQAKIKAGRVDSSMSFNEKVWALTARIPKGRVATYAQIARKLKTQGYRAVGNALNRNPYAPGVPCHRVVGSDGSLTGFASGVKKKEQLLRAEGVQIIGRKVRLDGQLAEL